MSERLINACENGNLSLVNQYINEGDDPSFDNNKAIQLASKYGHIDIVKVLLTDNRVDPAADDNEAIQMASLNGHTEVVRVLLADNRINPSADDNFAIQLASKYGNTNIVKVLLNDNRVDPSTYNNYAIRLASDNGHIDIVKLLLQSERFKFTDNLYKYPEIIDMLAQIRQEKSVKEMTLQMEIISLSDGHPIMDIQTL